MGEHIPTFEQERTQADAAEEERLVAEARVRELECGAGAEGGKGIEADKLNTIDPEQIARDPHKGSSTETERQPALSVTGHRPPCRSRDQHAVGKRRTIQATTNLPFDEWTEVFGSERLTGVLLDRLTHHVHILEMNGESYRILRSRENVAFRVPNDPDEK